MNHGESVYIGRTWQRFECRIKQFVSIGNGQSHQSAKFIYTQREFELMKPSETATKEHYTYHFQIWALDLKKIMSNLQENNNVKSYR